MKYSLWSVHSKIGAKTLATTKSLARLATVGAMLAFGGLAARAAGPVLTVPASVTLGEDTFTDVSVGVTDAAVPIFTVTTVATSSNTNLVSNASLVFSGFGTNRLLAITPGLHQFGSATITVIASDSQPSSTTNTFTVNVTFTNYPPVFLASIVNQTNNENAPSLVLPFSVSDIQTPGSNLIITATSSNTSLVASSNLVISGTGTNCALTINQTTNQNGTTVIELVVTDSGGDSATNDFVLDVWAVNQPPTFTMTTNLLTCNEYSGAVTFPGFISGVSSGPTNQSSESNWFVLQYPTNFFTQPPVLSSNGTLAFEVVSNQFGTNAIVFILNTSGSTTNGGQNSLTNTLTLRVPYSLQPPSFSLATNIFLVTEETPAVTNTHFVTARSNGPTNESSQSWTYTITTATNSPTNAAFSPLSLATNGTLIFQPKAHSFGTNTVTVVMTIGGRDTNGWINSCTNTFEIEVAQTNHAPVIVGATNRTVLENGTNGLTAAIEVWSYDQSTNFLFTATSSNTSLATVSITTNSAGTSNVFYTLTFTLATNSSGSATLHLAATEGPVTTSTNFTLAVTLVNHAPSFTLATNMVAVSEETAMVTNTNFVTSVSKGPSNQSSETYTFTLTTATNSPTNAAFTTLSLATNGTLTILPKAHSFGTNIVTVVMTDSGGNASGGVNTCTNSFEIEVVQTNHAPGIVGATNRTVLENGTNGLTAAIEVWSYDKKTNFLLTATSSNTSLATVSVTTNSSGTSNVFYTLTFTLATNNSGTSAIQLTATEGPLTTTSNFTLAVTLVNHTPSFALATNFVAAGEETAMVTNTNFVTSLSKGPSNQSSETYTYTLTTPTNSPTNAVFTTLSLATNGTLTFQPKAHSFGTNTVTVVMTDSGGNANSGINTSTNTFQIGITQTNHAPMFVGATNRTVLENATNGLTAAIEVLSYDKTTNFLFTATSSNTSLATVSVTTNSAGTSNVFYTLTFALVTSNSGTATIQLAATEGSLTTTTNFTLTVTLINHSPSFTLATNFVAVGEESGVVTNTNFVSSLSKGPSNQSGETYTFTLTTVTNSPTNAIFTTLSLATNGTLTIMPKAHSFGTNTVTVVMTDSGGNANGGVNTFTNTFEIGVVQTNHAPVITGATNRTIVENATSGLTAAIGVWNYDQTTNFTLTATSLSNGMATVSVTATNSANYTSNVTYTLTFAPGANANGSVPIQLVAGEGSLFSTNTFTLTITPLSNAPSFTLATNFVLVNEETPGVTNIGFVPGWRSTRVWTFTCTTVTNNPTNVVFTALPAVTTNGALTFSPAAHSYGTNLVTVVMSDNGTNSFTNAFEIGVQQISHAPVIVGSNLTVLENATGGLTTSIDVWDYDQSTNFILTATSLDTSLVTVSVTGTNSGNNTSNVVYTLTFALATNASGTATIQLSASEGVLSSTTNLTLTVTLVNQSPSYNFGTNNMTNDVLVVAENAGLTTVSNFLTNMSAGPANQSSETLTYAVFAATNSPTNAQFAQLPTVDTNGTLSFTTATNSFGTNEVTVVMTDSGSVSNGGVIAYSNSFQLEVTQVQYPPAFTGLSDVTIFENATTGLTLPFTLYDPLTTNFTVTCVSSDTNLAAVSASGIGTSYAILFAPLTNANGSTTITVTADDGTLTNSTNFTLIVTWVNQAPWYTLLASSVTVDQYNVPVTVSNVVTNIFAGPTNSTTQAISESTQLVTFTVTNSSPSSFLVVPAIDTNGTLTFTPGNEGATVTVGVQAVDNGGTNNGGVNASGFQTFTITIPPNAFQYLTGPFAGLFYNTNDMDNASSGFFSLVLSNTGAFTGYVLCAGDSNTFTGQFSISSNSASVAAAAYALDLSIDTSANWTESVSGSVSNTGATWNSALLSYLAGYSASFSTSLAGEYLMAMPGANGSANAPAGASLFSLSLSNTGFASLDANMADSAAASQVSQISLYGLYPLYLPLYSNGVGGSVVGWLTFTGVSSNAVSTNSILTWFNEAGTTVLYPAGFTNQAAPMASLYSSNLSQLLSFSSGSVILSGGNLPDSITNAVTITNNIISVDLSATNSLSLTIDRFTGEISGSFVDQNGNTNVIDSVILQNTTNGCPGYFLGTNQVGSFILIGN